jgi:hypothetical protein
MLKCAAKSERACAVSPYGPLRSTFPAGTLSLGAGCGGINNDVGRQLLRFLFREFDGARPTAAVRLNDGAVGAELRGQLVLPRLRSTRGRFSLCVVLSLRHFRREICRSLSLGGGWPPDPARRFLFCGIVGRGFGATMELGRLSCSQLRGRPA